MGRASKDKRDIYYRRAKEEGYRARSAYKLLQIHEEFNILSEDEITTGAVDLCAAPGSWSQVLANHFKTIASSRDDRLRPGETAATGRHAHGRPKIIAVDLQEMAPIDGVEVLQGDITSEATAQTIIRLLNDAADEDEDDDCGSRVNEEGEGAVAAREGSDGGMRGNEEAVSLVQSKRQKTESRARGGKPLRKADIVICDGAPDVTGMHELDEYLQHQLLLAALTITTCVLRHGGSFVAKMFRGPNTSFLVAKSEVFFTQVRVVKPKSSRNASMESFLVCQGFQVPPGHVPRFLNSSAASVASPTATSAAAAATEACGGNHTHRKEGSCVDTGTDIPEGCYTPSAPLYGYQCTASGRTGGGRGDDGVVDASATLPSPAVQRYLLPFLSCGDLSGFDADMCYDRVKGAKVLPPIQPPIEAPYLKHSKPT